MYTRIVRLQKKETFPDWIQRHSYPLTSPKYRRYYAEMIFSLFCMQEGIWSQRVNPHYEASFQILPFLLRKIQQKELQILGKIPFDFFCQEGEDVFFVLLKMGISGLLPAQRACLRRISHTKVFLFQVFEDGELHIKELKLVRKN